MVESTLLAVPGWRPPTDEEVDKVAACVQNYYLQVHKRFWWTSALVMMIGGIMFGAAILNPYDSLALHMSLVIISALLVVLGIHLSGRGLRLQDDMRIYVRKRFQVLEGTVEGLTLSTKAERAKLTFAIGSKRIGRAEVRGAVDDINIGDPLLFINSEAQVASRFVGVLPASGEGMVMLR